MDLVGLYVGRTNRVNKPTALGPDDRSCQSGPRPAPGRTRLPDHHHGHSPRWRSWEALTSSRSTVTWCRHHAGRRLGPRQSRILAAASSYGAAICVAAQNSNRAKAKASADREGYPGIERFRSARDQSRALPGCRDGSRIRGGSGRTKKCAPSWSLASHARFWGGRRPPVVPVDLPGRNSVQLGPGSAWAEPQPDTMDTPTPRAPVPGAARST